MIYIVFCLICYECFGVGFLLIWTRLLHGQWSSLMTCAHVLELLRHFCWRTSGQDFTNARLPDVEVSLKWFIPFAKCWLKVQCESLNGYRLASADNITDANNLKKTSKIHNINSFVFFWCFFCLVSFRAKQQPFIKSTSTQDLTSIWIILVLAVHLK